MIQYLDADHIRLGIEAADLGTWSLDLASDGTMVRSLRHDQIFGHAERQPEWGLEIAHDRIVEEDQPVFRAAIQTAFETGALAFEGRVRWPDGSVHWIAKRGKITYDDAGRPVKMVGVIADITTRKITEERLRNSEARLHRAQAIAKIGSWWFDCKRRVFEGTPEFYRILGTSPDQPVRFGDDGQLIHPDDRERVDQCWQEFLAGSSYDVEYRLVVANEVRWVHDVGELERDSEGSVLAAFGTLQDITDQRYTAEELRRSEARFRGIFENALVGAVQIGSDGKFIEVNNCFCSMVGRSREELVGRLSPLDLTHPSDVSRTLVSIQGALAGPAHKSVVEKRCLRPDGSELWARVWLTPLEDGNSHSVAAVIEDVTAQKEAQVQLQSLAEGQAFLLELSDALGNASDPAAITSRAAAMLGKKLGGDCQLHLSNPGIAYGALSDVAGQQRIPSALYDALAASGQEAVCSNVLSEPILEPSVRDAALESGVQAFLFSPVFSNGRQIGNAVVYCDAPRYWRACEVAIAKETVSRTWAAFERAQSEVQLRLSESRLRIALNAARMGIWEWNLSTDELLWTPQVFDLLGEEANSFKPTLSLLREKVPPEDWEHIQDVIDGSVRTGAHHTVQFRVRLPSGELRWMESIGQALSNPGRMFGIIRDVTGQKLVEDAIRSQLHEIESLYDNAPIGLCVLDPEFRFLRINKSLAEMNGIPVEDHLGEVAWDLLPDLQASVEPFFKRVFATGVAVCCETVGETPKAPGVKRWWSQKLYPLKNASGEVVAVGATVEEITERRRGEQRTKLLLAEVNHRAKNLLSVVQSVAELTVHEVEPGTFARTFEQRMAGLAACHDLLVRSAWRGVDLRALITSQLTHVSSLIGSRIWLDGPRLEVNAQAAQAIGMAIHEMCTNAIKHGALSSPAGRVAIKWTIDSGDVVQMVWQETGGPHSSPPTRKGFGSTVLKDNLEHALDAVVEMKFPPEGFSWVLKVPTPIITESGSDNKVIYAHLDH